MLDLKNELRVCGNNLTSSETKLNITGDSFGAGVDGVSTFEGTLFLSSDEILNLKTPLYTLGNIQLKTPSVRFRGSTHRAATQRKMVTTNENSH